MSSVKSISSLKDFNKFIENNYSSLIICYFYENVGWCNELTQKLDILFQGNCNGNTKILKIDLGKLTNKSIISECNINAYPIVRLYKYSKPFQEIYCTYPNIEEIISSFLN